MFTYSLVGLAVLILAAILIYKLTKAVFKTIILVSVIILALLIIFGFLLVKDVNDLKANLPVKDSLLILEHQGQPVAGLTGPFMADQQMLPISEEQLNQIKTEGFGEDYYKVFVINSSAFESVAEINLDGVIWSKEEAFSILESGDPLDILVNERLKQEEVTITPAAIAAAKEEMAKQGVKTNADVRNIIFGQLMSAAMEKDGPAFWLENFKDGQIEIEPETTAFKFIKILPTSFITRYIK